MLKITQQTTPTAACRLILEGRLLQPWIEELLSVCKIAGDPISQIELDLVGVSYIDSSSRVVLRELIRSGATVVGSSPFIQELLQEERLP